MESTPIKTNLGVIVNDRMQTNIENVYADDDFAELSEKIGWFWGTAIERGKIAGYNIADREATYTAVPVDIMNAFSITLFYRRK